MAVCSTMGGMKLPILLPKEFEDLREVESENELFARISPNIERAISFLGIAGGDETWCETHLEFVKKVFHWLTDLFFNEQLNIALAERVKEIVHAEPSTFTPILYYDMTLQLGKEEMKVNSLLMAASSPYFNRLVRQLSAQRDRLLRLSEVNLEVAKPLIVMLHEGIQTLWRKEQDELEKILTLASRWELHEIAEECESLLTRYIRLENVEKTLFKARQKKWYKLESAAAEIYNRLEIGLKLHTPEPGVLVAEFLDLVGLTTLTAYQKLAPLVSICKFTGRLPADPDFVTVLQETPHLTGLDFSESEEPPYLMEAIPTTLHSLNLKRASWADDEHISRLLSHVRELTTLSLQDLTWIGLPIWTALSSLRDLTHLNLSGLKQLKDIDLSLIALSPTALEKLSLANCKNLSSLGIQEILRGAPRLTHLDLSHTAVSDQNLAEMASRLVRLEEINLSWASSLSERGVISLFKQRDSLRHVILEGIPLSREILKHLSTNYPYVKIDTE